MRERWNDPSVDFLSLWKYWEFSMWYGQNDNVVHDNEVFKKYSWTPDKSELLFS